MNKQSAMLLSLWTEGRKEIFTDIYLPIFWMMFYLSGTGMSGLRCLRLAGAVRAMQIAQDGGGLKPGMTKTKEPESYIDVRGRAVINGAT
jgi:hypothetical protein